MDKLAVDEVGKVGLRDYGGMEEGRGIGVGGRIWSLGFGWIQYWVCMIAFNI